MNNCVLNFCVKSDNICDYIPFVSSVNNLIDLFQKCVVMPMLSHETIADNYYYTHLQEKSFARSFILLIPVLGNGFFIVYDFFSTVSNNRENLTVSDQIRDDEVSVSDISNCDGSQKYEFEEFGDFTMASQTVTTTEETDNQKICELPPITKEESENEKFMLEAVKLKGIRILEQASRELLKDKKFMFVAIKNNEVNILDDARNRINFDKEFALQLHIKHRD